MTPPSAFVYSDEYVSYHFSSRHPLQQVRLQMHYRLLDAYGIFDGVASELVEPIPATEADLLLVHTPEYIETMRRLSAGERPERMREFGFGPGDNPAFPGMYESTLLYVGATIECVRRILSGQNLIAFNNSGGLHHAMPDRASGFCLANDCAIAAKLLSAAGRRVAYIDIDAHHGDGVQSIFYSDPNVFTLSIHETPETLFPRDTGFVEELGIGDGLGYSVNVPLCAASTDEHYRYVFDTVVDPLIAWYAPDVIILELGADTHFQDPLTHLSLTSSGWLESVQRVVDYGKPIVALGGGGYNLKTVPRLWTLGHAAFSNVVLPDTIPENLQAEFAVETLHDRELPRISLHNAQAARSFALKTVYAIHDSVFPMHGLKRPQKVY